MSYLSKELKKGLSSTWSDSKSEEETTNIVIAYSGQCKSDGESSTEDLFEEDLDASFRFLHFKWK